MAQLKNTTVNDTGSLAIPQGNTSQRPGTPSPGMIRNNSDSGVEIYYSDSVWDNIKRFSPIAATGGSVTDITIDGRLFRQHQFSGNANYNFTVTSIGTTQGEVEYEIVLDGYDPGSYGTAQLDGTSVRKLSPFSSEPMFRYTSRLSASQIGYSSPGGDIVGTDDATLGRAQVGGSCRTGVTFASGIDLHLANGGRMPTLEEYLNNVTQGNGCGHDNVMNWTATKGTTSATHYICDGRSPFNRVGTVQALSNGSTSALRDVADVNPNRADAIILQDSVIFNELRDKGLRVDIVRGPFVTAGRTYNLLLASGIETAIPNTGPQATNTKSGVDNRGTVYIRYPLEG